MRRLLLPVFWSLLGAAVIGLLIYGLSTQGASTSLDEALRHGKRPIAPEATMLMPTLTGAGRSSLAAYRGKVVIVNFWASWCTPCEREAPGLERLERQLASHDATVLGITYEDITSDSLKFAHEFNLTYPNLRDVNGSFAHSYGTVQIPESFVIDRTGHVAEISRGEVTKPFLEFAVQLAEHS